RLADRHLERAQVDLAQRALADLGADGHALELGVVAGEVLEAGGDAARLHAAHERGRDAAAEVRVLGVALEVAAADRRALDVDRRAEEHLRALALRLFAQGGANGLDQLRVPGRGEGDADREGGGGDAAARLAAGAGRAIGELEGGDAEALDGGGPPCAGAWWT